MSHGIEDKNVKQNVIQVLTKIQANVSNSNSLVKVGTRLKKQLLIF